MADYYYGIDFGTTNSAMYQYVKTATQIQGMAYGDSQGRPTPSIVAVDNESGEILVGREAYDKRNQLSETHTFFPSIKTILDDDNFEVTVAGRIFHATDIAYEIFSKMKEEAKHYSNGITKATVSIPVGFTPQKRRRLREAAEMAGIEIESFISEPTAAFFANYSALRYCSNVAVFDWGGGTLDVSVLKIVKNDVFELATANMYKAGDDIDEILARKIHSTISQKNNLSVKYEELSHKTKDELLVRVEQAKCKLSDPDCDFANISLLNYNGKGACTVKLWKETFDSLLADIVSQADDCLKKAINQSNLSLENIDKIIMVGGSSNLHLLKTRFQEEYGEKIYYPEESDAQWNIAQGAAMLSVNPGDYKTNQSVSLVMSDDIEYELLKKNSLLSDTYKKTYFALTDLSEEIRLVFGGSKDIINSDYRYRSIQVDGYKFLQEQIILESEVDDDLIFVVKAKSSMKPARTAVAWEYPNMKFYYHIPNPLII